MASLIGPNGAGKTNLLEALYFALTGRSFRTSDRRDLIPFGAQLARAEAVVRDDDGIEHRLLASVSRGRGKAPPPRRQPGRRRDRGPAPSAGRRLLARTGWRWSRDRRPSAGPTSTASSPPAGRRGPAPRVRFGQALAQRNALLARGPAGGGELEAWDASFAEAAAALVEARAEALEDLAPRFASAAAELGLEGEATLEYAPRSPGSAEEIREGLAERREADLRLGRSSWGPHLDEVKIAAADRALRRFGSQGQQRTALLALLFAERAALAEARRVTPLLLLDDVMSELDPERRERLVELLAGPGQVVITAATEESVPPAAARPSDPDAARAAPAEPPPRRHDPPQRTASGGRGAARRPRRCRPEDTASRRSRRRGGRPSASASPPSLSPSPKQAGTVTISCSDPVWADELDLMQEQLLEQPPAASRRAGTAAFAVPCGSHRPLVTFYPCFAGFLL